jgi:hypothetical protein
VSVGVYIYLCVFFHDARPSGPILWAHHALDSLRFGRQNAGCILGTLIVALS